MGRTKTTIDGRMVGESPIFVSIIIPVYNSVTSINACLDSVLNQTYRCFEVIVVDDGSSDGSSVVCDDYACYDGVTAIHKKNGGVSSARNIGLKVALGEYICFVDSDDVLTPDYLEVLVDARLRHPEAGHVWSCFYVAESIGEQPKSVHLAAADELESVFERKDYMHLCSLWLTQMPWHRLYSKKVIDDARLRFRLGVDLGEDAMFNLAYLDAEPRQRIVVENRATYCYVRTESDSLDHKFRSDLLQLYENLDDEIESYLLKWGVSEKEAWRQFYLSKFWHYDQVLHNTFNEKNTGMTPFQKISFNNKILRSDSFRNTFDKSVSGLPKFHKIAYRGNSFMRIACMEFLFRRLNRWRGMFDV